MEVSRRAATIFALRIVWRSKLMVTFCFIILPSSGARATRETRRICITRRLRARKREGDWLRVRVEKAGRVPHTRVWRVVLLTFLSFALFFNLTSITVVI